MGILQNLPGSEISGTVRKRYRTHRSYGYCGTGVQNSRYKNDIVPRVLVALAYRASRSSGYGYECRTELTEVLSRVIPGVNTPGVVCAYPSASPACNLLWNSRNSILYDIDK